MEDKRCALVTGGNKGIGFEVCSQLASNGIQVILTDRDESFGVEVVQKLNTSGFPSVVFHQKAHLLTDILKQTCESVEECIKTNYYGTKAVTEAFLPLLQLSAESPRIVNVTSLYGELFNGWPLTVSAYKVSKTILNAYTRLMAKKHPDMLINCVHPGCVITDMSAQTGFITPEEGAKAPVMAALLPNDGPSGVYFSQMQLTPF